MNDPNQRPDLDSVQNTVAVLRENLTKVIIGKEAAVDQVLVALFCGGNILLEDVPGVGKTTLAKALARSLDAKYSRIQFTPDLLPADILGGSIFNPQSGDFTFRPGPIFTNILLADEINRASPRTQSALLESMTEGQATVEGVGRILPRPFVVIATQNPIEYHGTYPLPEAQLDRFMVRLEIGYPNESDETDILFSQQLSHPLDAVKPVASCDDLMVIQKLIREIEVERTVAAYIVAIVQETRNDGRLRLGASPRASLMMFRAAQALAFTRKRTFVIPDDIKELAIPVLCHRVVLDSRAKYAGSAKAEIITDILAKIPVPV